jgi:peptidoglycan/LPS O-acetylase OafA/YrhL
MSNPSLPDPAPVGSPGWAGATSVALGLIGLGLSWLPPYSIILSLFGVLCGLFALTRPSGRRGNGLWFALGGTVLSLIAVGACVFLMPGWWSHPWPLGGH